MTLRGATGRRSNQQSPQARDLAQNLDVSAPSYALDVFESDDEDVHQQHLRPPAGAPRQGTQQIVVVLLGRVAVQLLQAEATLEKQMNGKNNTWGIVAGCCCRSEANKSATREYWMVSSQISVLHFEEHVLL